MKVFYVPSTIQKYNLTQNEYERITSRKRWTNHSQKNIYSKQFISESIANMENVRWAMFFDSQTVTRNYALAHQVYDLESQGLWRKPEAGFEQHVLWRLKRIQHRSYYLSGTTWNCSFYYIVLRCRNAFDWSPWLFFFVFSFWIWFSHPRWDFLLIKHFWLRPANMSLHTNLYSSKTWRYSPDTVFHSSLRRHLLYKLSFGNNFLPWYSTQPVLGRCMIESRDLRNENG